MKRIIPIIICLLVAIQIIVCQNSILRISQDEYSIRRQNLLNSLDSGTAVAMRSADYKIRSNDVGYRYRQESNFLYLTGWKHPNCYLIFSRNGLVTDGNNKNIFLFTPDNKESTGNYIGAQEILLPVGRFRGIFDSVLNNINLLYVSSPDMPFVNDWLNDKKVFTDKNTRKEIEQKYPDLKVKNVLPLFGKFREIKSAPELELMQKSIELTWNGINRAMADCGPGKWEYELQAGIEYEMTRGGADFPSWTPIIGSGENSLILHYDENRRKMQNGDLVLMDVGAEYGGYACDITRTIPVSGKFSKAQAEVYSVVLEAQKEVIATVRPGITMKEMDKKASDLIKEKGYGKYIRHGVTHPVGIDVHDIWASDTVRAGMVLTVEPGIYIPADAEEVESAYRGFGVRIEDDVLVTETGFEILTKNVPKEISEIEELMKK